MARLTFVAALVVYSALTVGCTALAESHRASQDPDVVPVKIEKTYWQEAEEFNAKHLDKAK